MKNELLIIPDKEDVERFAIARIWEAKGGEVLRIGKFWIKPETHGKRVTLYGFDSFCLVLAQILELNMVMPKDESIADCQQKFIKRKIEIFNLSEIDEIKFPKFIKPVTPKLFKAEVFGSNPEFQDTIVGIKPTERIICSEIISVEKEVRSFILENKIQDLAFYEGTGDIEEARFFIRQFLKETTLILPTTFVLDIGFNEQMGWFIIEFNASWGAGLNFCDPEKVIACIRAAAE